MFFSTTQVLYSFSSPKFNIRELILALGTVLLNFFLKTVTATEDFFFIFGEVGGLGDHPQELVS